MPSACYGQAALFYMTIDILYIIIGAIIVLWGADKLTEGAVAIAERLRMPQMVIGLTIVAMGTSMPEFCVSLASSLKGTADLAIGNVVGSNIFNSMLIVGASAMIAPMTILPTTVRRDIPFALLASVVLLLMCIDGTISITDGAILFAMFLFYMAFTLRKARQPKDATAEQPTAKMRPIVAVCWLLVGLTCLIFGSNIFVEGASDFASQLGVSDAVIGLTIVAGGTSLPELATSMVSARKGQSGIAIGNVLGSNVFNILMILGITGIVSPMTIKGITNLDFSLLVVSMIALLLFAYTKLKIERWEGAVLTIAFFAYISYLVINA